MKKTLIALAVLAAAGAASAQSSVTLFGIVDATLAHGSGRGAVSADRTQLTSSGYNSSRLGFRGTEDLGGGMSASFWLEAGLANDSGTGIATNVNNQSTGGALPGSNGGQGLVFNRRSTISLASSWGEVRLGRDFASTFWNLTVFDPFGTNGVGTTQVLNGVSGNGFQANNLGGPVNIRVSNALAYFLPANLGGFYGQVQYYLGENLQTGAATEDDGKGWNGRVGYAAGPFNVAVSTSKTDYATGDIKTTNIGGQWDFGVAKLMGHYSRDRVDSPASVTGKGWLIGTLVPVGAGEIRASWSQYKVDVAGGDPRSRKIALGYVHNLSKRTALYTTVAQVRNRDGAAAALNGAVTDVNQRSTGYDFGVRHSF